MGFLLGIFGRLPPHPKHAGESWGVFNLDLDLSPQYSGIKGMKAVQWGWEGRGGGRGSDGGVHGRGGSRRFQTP